MSKFQSKIVLIAIFLLSTLLITVFLRPSDIISDTPIYTDDYSLHYSECLSAQQFFSSAGHCWGYDPFLLAGFPRGSLANADNKAWELFYFILFPLLGKGLAFKAYLILFLLLYPFFIYLTARNFNLTREQSIVASVLALLFLILPAVWQPRPSALTLLRL